MIQLDQILKNTNELSFRNLSLIEQKFWWATVALISMKQSCTMKIDRKQIEILAGIISKLTEKDFIRNMNDMTDKILRLYYSSVKDANISSNIFQISKPNKYNEIEIKISKLFLIWINKIVATFPIASFEFIRNFNSEYTIELYRYLVIHKSSCKSKRYSGFLSINWDEFKKLMNIPKNYSLSDVKRRVLSPAEKELSILDSAPMQYVNIKIVNKMGYKRIIDKIEFSFKFKNARKNRILDDIIREIIYEQEENFEF